LEKEELRTSLTGVQAEILTAETDLLAAIQKSRVGQELWPILVVLSLVFFLLEGYFAHRFSRASSMSLLRNSGTQKLQA
jgi:hypothetical protein